MDKYNLSRRSRSEANYQKYNPQGDPFAIKSELSIEEIKLNSLALGLFWGEGNKNLKVGVRLGNSDVNLIIVWCRFLRTICCVNENRIHFYLQTFKDNNIEKAKNYWANKLEISADRIHTGTPITSLGKGTYKKISQFGVMTVEVTNTHLGKWILDELAKLGYNPHI